MPFLSDTTWPTGLLEIFDICSQELESRHGDFENRYNGPYNKLLTYCFGPGSFEFFVAAQPLPRIPSATAMTS
ncbi:hypothetical protein BD779DRAFT_1749785 [Infundibulicybe gibba]|nr:hypothetical protein BD779DRAFT_1749785 [Infundibulicybe gibba]